MKPGMSKRPNGNQGFGTHSRRRFSINSGLNLSPVTYSAVGENMSELPKGSHTKSMFVRERWDYGRRKVGFEVIPKENKVLKASPRRRVRHRKYWEIGLCRWVSPVEIRRIQDNERAFAETR